MQVKGFGDKRFQALSSYLAVDGKTTLTTKVSRAKAKSRKSSKQPTSTASR